MMCMTARLVVVWFAGFHGSGRRRVEVADDATDSPESILSA
jgi:hypothetical protein